MIAGKIEVIVWITKVKNFHLQNAPRDGEDGCRRGKEYNKITSEDNHCWFIITTNLLTIWNTKVKGSDANHHYLTSCLIMTASDLSDQVLVMLSDKLLYVKLMSLLKILYLTNYKWQMQFFHQTKDWLRTKKIAELVYTEFFTQV